MAPLERAMVVSYRLSNVTVALSVTIRPQFVIEFLRRSNQQGVGHFGPKFRGVPLEADPSCWGWKEWTSQANYWWNYFQRIPTYVTTIHQRHRQTDRQTTCDRNTALCTKVHRAVKSKQHKTQQNKTTPSLDAFLWHLTRKQGRFTLQCFRAHIKRGEQRTFSHDIIDWIWWQHIQPLLRHHSFLPAIRNSK